MHVSYVCMYPMIVYILSMYLMDVYILICMCVCNDCVYLMYVCILCVYVSYECMCAVYLYLLHLEIVSCILYCVESLISSTVHVLFDFGGK